jgi:hypothetical protein
MLKGTRKANGQGYTYKNGSSYRTVIKHKGYTVTASAKTIQESKKIAKEKVKSLPYSEYGLILKQKITLGEYLTNWLLGMGDRVKTTTFVICPSCLLELKVN